MGTSNKLLDVILVYKSTDNNSAKIIQRVNKIPDLNAYIETGRYYYDNENIICISSAIGCAHGCAFCDTTKPFEYKKGRPVRFLRYLSAEEIIEQVINSIHEIPLIDKHVLFSYMGMGEPFDNIREIKKSIKILEKIYPKSRVTISTIAQQPNQIINFANEIASGIYSIPIKLHISLHGSSNRQRRQLIPHSSTINKTIKAANYFAIKTNQDVKLNYVLINNINSSIEDARKLGNLLKGYDRIILKISKLNTKNKNALVCKQEADKFEEAVKSFGVRTCRFTSLGQDINAGCGQLVKSSGPFGATLEFFTNGKF